MDQFCLADTKQAWIKDYIMEALKRRMIDQAQINDETVQDIIAEIKGHIRAMPLKDSDGTFKIKKHKGSLETYGLMADDISVLDRIELGFKSETLRSKTKDPWTNFIAAYGYCDLHYVKKGENKIHKLKPGNPKRVKAETPFALSSNGAECRIFLIQEKE